MAVNVIAPNQIQITDFRPRTDTLYTHTGEFDINDNVLDLHDAIDMTGRRKVLIDGVTYTMANVADLTSEPYTRQCMDMDNAAGTVIPNDTSHMFSKQFSLIVRYKWDTQSAHASPRAILAKGDHTGTDWEFGFVANTSREIGFKDDPTGGYISSGLYTNFDDWSFLAVSVDGTAIAFYQDENTSTGTSTAGIRTNKSNDIRVGEDPSVGNNLFGLIDEIQIYDRVLSPAVIESIRVNHTYLTDAVGIYRFKSYPSLVIPDEGTDKRLRL